MKTISFFLITFLFFLSSCNSITKTNGQKVKFGIHEILKISEIPKSIIDTLKSKNVLVKNNKQQFVIGYITKSDTMVLQLDLTRQNIKLVKTVHLIDKKQKYYALIAIRPKPVINNTDIKETEVNSNTVEIYFNWEGAKKWAELTNKSIGKRIAFMIENKVYSMPLIENEMRNGMAIINGFNNQIAAENISESLNLVNQNNF